MPRWRRHGQPEIFGWAKQLAHTEVHPPRTPQQAALLWGPGVGKLRMRESDVSEVRGGWKTPHEYFPLVR